MGFAALPIFSHPRVGWPNGGVPALSEPDFGVLLGHYYVIGYCIYGILLNSKHLSQFCLVEFLTVLYHYVFYDNYLLLVYPHSPFTR